MSNGTTNVDHNEKIKACIAQLEVEMKGLKPISKAEISIRDYLKVYPGPKVKAEDNKSIDIAKRNAVRKANGNTGKQGEQVEH